MRLTSSGCYEQGHPSKFEDPQSNPSGQSGPHRSCLSSYRKILEVGSAAVFKNGDGMLSIITLSQDVVNVGASPTRPFLGSPLWQRSSGHCQHRTTYSDEDNSPVSPNDDRNGCYAYLKEGNCKKLDLAHQRISSDSAHI
jgi:hypothetical protein